VIKNAIDKLKPAGSTDIGASVEKAIAQLILTSGPEPNLIVLLTDGKTNTTGGKNVGEGHPLAVNALLEASKTAKKNGIVIHGINYGNDVDNKVMRQVAEGTDGKFYHAPDDKSLAIVYGEIASKTYIRLTYVH
jgi:Mg-chelatase subunit ChlD